LVFNEAVAAQAADDELLMAIDIAEVLVGEGLPFRQAHEFAGRLVGEALREGKALKDVVASTPEGERFAFLFADGSGIARRTSPGSSGPATAAQQSDELHQILRELHVRVK